MVPIMSHMNPVQNVPPYYFKIHSTIVLSSTPSLPKFLFISDYSSKIINAFLPLLRVLRAPMMTFSLILSP
jgi:hypothetical protein